MAEILQTTPNQRKPRVFELALGSGRLAIVPSHVGLRGALAEYSVVLSPPTPVTWHVATTDADEESRSEGLLFDRVVIGPQGGQDTWRVRVAVSHLVLADIDDLYCAGHGPMWHRPKEAERAIKACSSHKNRTGGAYSTDYGERAVALRVANGPVRALVAAQGDRMELRVLDPPDPDEE